MLDKSPASAGLFIAAGGGAPAAAFSVVSASSGSIQYLAAVTGANGRLTENDIGRFLCHHDEREHLCCHREGRGTPKRRQPAIRRYRQRDIAYPRRCLAGRGGPCDRSLQDDRRFRHSHAPIGRFHHRFGHPRLVESRCRDTGPWGFAPLSHGSIECSAANHRHPTVRTNSYKGSRAPHWDLLIECARARGFWVC